MEILQTSFVEMVRHKGFAKLTEGYAQESKMSILPDIDWQPTTYLAMERTGALKCVIAKIGDKIIGFATLIISVIPHYNKTMATVESIFVGEEYRKKGAGLKLIKGVEKVARECEAIAVFLSAPHQSRLCEVAPRIGYEKTNEIFTKVL